MKLKTFYLNVDKNVIKWMLKYGELPINKAKHQFPINKWLSGNSSQTKMLFKSSLDFSSAEHQPYIYLLNHHLPNGHWNFEKYYVDKSKSNEIPNPKLVSVYCHLKTKQSFLEHYILRNSSIYKYRWSNLINHIQSRADPRTCDSNNMFKIQELIGIDSIILHTHNLQQAYLRLMNRLSSIGVMVMQNNKVANCRNRQLNPNKLLGMALYNKYMPLIFVNSNADLESRYSTLIRGFINISLGKNEILNTTVNKAKSLNDYNYLISDMVEQILSPFYVHEVKSNPDYHLNKLYLDPKLVSAVTIDEAEGRISIVNAAEKLDSTVGNYKNRLRSVSKNVLIN